MFEKSMEKGSVWVTLKRSSPKSKVQRNKMKAAGQLIEHRCLVRATDGNVILQSVRRNIDVFKLRYATILRAHMTALKKRERKDKKKVVETDKEGAVAATAAPKKKS